MKYYTKQEAAIATKGRPELASAFHAIFGPPPQHGRVIDGLVKRYGKC